MDSLLDFLSPEIMDLLNEEMSDSEQTLVTGQVDPAIQQEQLTEHSVHDYNLEPPTKQQKRTFAPRKNEDEVMKAKLSAIPSKTMADTKYCVNVWQQWCEHISTEYGEEVTPLKEMLTQELSTKLCLFVFEVRKQNGELLQQLLVTRVVLIACILCNLPAQLSLLLLLLTSNHAQLL